MTAPAPVVDALASGALRYDPDAHRYYLGAREVPSVTRVLAETRISAWDHVDPDVLATAAARGRAVHRAVELAVLGRLDPTTVDPVVEPYLHAFDGWHGALGAVGLRVRGVEVALADAALAYAGTVDLVLEAPAGLVVVDVKTSSTLPRAYRIQLAAYAHLVAAHYGRPVVRREVLALRDDGTAATTAWDDPAAAAADWHEFRAALYLVHRRRAEEVAPR